LLVTGLAAVFFPKLRNAGALTAESLMEANAQQSAAEPID